MRPFDALTDIDKKTIEAYLSVYGNTECGPLPLVLRYWNKNKTTLFKALGNKLRVSKMIDVPANIRSRINELEEIYHPYTIWYDSDIVYIREHATALRETVKNEFIADVLIYWVNQNYCLSDLYIISRLFLHKNFSKGYIRTIDTDIPYHCHDFKCTLKNGMKTIKTIQKVLKATNYPRMDLFENWCNVVNRISCTEGFKSKLTISIHPLDFMSMSDNTCNWRSCMSWANSGCYRSGTLEMMNSNVAVVAYLESPREFRISLSEDDFYDIPNKRWRSLFYVHKNILLGGKSYPYNNKELTFIVMDMLRELVQKNLHWDYQFINQEYQDLKHLEGNFYVRDIWNVDYYIYNRNKHHKILVYTNAMYNDMIESKYPEYYCCRNKVKRTIKLCLSGPATCICCGNIIIQDKNWIESYDDLGSCLVCNECIDKSCRACGKIKYNPKYRTDLFNVGNFCSDECCSDYVYFPDFNRAITKESIASSDDCRIYTIIYNKDVLSDDILVSISKNFQSIKEDFLFADWVKQIRQNYTCKMYIFPRTFASYGFINLNHSTYNAKFINGTKKLYFLEETRAKQTIQKIESIYNRIPLVEYFAQHKEILIPVRKEV